MIMFSHYINITKTHNVIHLNAIHVYGITGQSLLCLLMQKLKTETKHTWHIWHKMDQWTKLMKGKALRKQSLHEENSSFGFIEAVQQLK